MTTDLPMFRTVGSDPKKNVEEKSIRCWDKNMENIVSGSTECWAHKLSKKIHLEEEYVWLAQPQCDAVPATTTKLKGTANCKQTNVPQTSALC